MVLPLVKLRGTTLRLFSSKTVRNFPVRNTCSEQSEYSKILSEVEITSLLCATAIFQTGDQLPLIIGSIA